MAKNVDNANEPQAEIVSFVFNTLIYTFLKIRSFNYCFSEIKKIFRSFFEYF